MVVLFLLLCALIAYAYAGYPLLIATISKVRPRPIAKREIAPRVTVIIAAHNEERHISQKISNVLALEYPAEQIDVIVGSDASTDRTNEIVQAVPDARVKLVASSNHHGKTSIQNQAAVMATGEVLVFTDATTALEPQSLRHLVSNFADDSVGLVGGRLVYVDRAKSSSGTGTIAYWSYEDALRVYESLANSLIGVSGCYYAVRRSAYQPIAPELISDFVIAPLVVMKGFRAVYESNATCYEDAEESAQVEFAMRVRVALRSLNALRSIVGVMNPFRYGLYAVQMFSHKLLRYSCGVLLAGLLPVTALLAGNPLFAAFFAVQVTGYLAGAATWLVVSRGGHVPRLLALPYYFLLSNMAALVAWYRFCRGENLVVWQPKR